MAVFVFSGFDVYDDCGIPKKAMAHALDILDSPILGTEKCAKNMDATCTIGKRAWSNFVSQPKIKKIG